MDIDELQKYISKYAVEVLKENGIVELFPPQAEVLDKVFSRRNLLLAMPTASGKTLLAELAMVREVIEGGKCLYVVPLRALAAEKYESFKKWEKIGIKVGISTGDYESRDEHLGECDIIVTTSEKADSLIRNSASWMSSVTCLVIDELHLLDSADRGATLEILITKMRRMGDIRVIGLSATAPNVDEIADWLDADYYVSEWRPVPLVEGYLCEGKVEMYKDGFKVREYRSNFEKLVEECISKGGGVLVFEATRRNAESTAVKLSAITSRYCSCEDLASKILEENDTEMSRRLADCVRKGCAFHHAGLLNEQRRTIERGFREGRIKVVVATPTLAAGVNLPARRVIVKSLYRYDGYSRRIKVSEYKQMAGRAGRPGMDDIGEAITLIRKKDKKIMLEKYIGGMVEPITSKLGTETHLRFHSLSLICEGYARSIEELEDFFAKTFFFKQNPVSLVYELERVTRQLDNWEFVEFDDLSGRIAPTKLGKLVSKLYIDPLTGFIFYDTIRRQELTEIGALHLICRTPDMERLHVRRNDEWVEEEAFRLRKELTYYPSEFSVDYEWFLDEVKTALCLWDWINELSEDEICSKYSIAPGDLRRIVETAEWLSHAMSRISEFIGEKSFSDLSLRLRYGVKAELLPLVKLKGVGRVRARKLFNAGIRTQEDLIEKKSLVSTVVGRKIAENLISQVQNPL